MTSRDEKRRQLADRLGYRERAAKTYSVAADAAAIGADFERVQPAREASLTADVLVPVCQSVLTGCFAGVLTGILVNARVGVITGVLVSGCSWLLLLNNHVAQLWRTDRLMSPSIDRHYSKSAAPRVVRVELVEGSRIRFVDVPITDEQLIKVARAVDRGQSFSRRGLSDVLSQDEYSKLSAALLRTGLLVEVGARRELTAAGRQLLKRVLT